MAVGTREILAELGDAFGIGERQLGAYCKALGDIPLPALGKAVHELVNTYDRGKPTIATIRSLASRSRETQRSTRLDEYQTRAAIERRLKALDWPITEERILAHWQQFAETFEGEWAPCPIGSVHRSARPIGPEELATGAKLLQLWRAGIIWDHKTMRWTDPGQKPLPLTQPERDAMRFCGWRPPMPAIEEIHARHAQMRAEGARVPAKAQPYVDALAAEVPF